VFNARKKEDWSVNVADGMSVSMKEAYCYRKVPLFNFVHVAIHFEQTEFTIVEL
jgi:hypothetical protein